MSEKIEGTLVLDGLIQGRFDGSEDARQAMEQWRDAAENLGLRLNLQVEGNSFNFLAEDVPAIAAKLEPKPEMAIVKALEGLWQVLRPHFRGEMLSTIRSSEYQPGCEVQTLYIFAADGSVQFRQKTTDAHTVAPPQPLTTREKVKLAGMSVAVLVVIFLLSSIFVDYRSFVSGLWRQAMPFQAQNVDVVTKDYEAFFTVVDKAKSSDGKNLLLKLQRTDRFPKTDADLDVLAIAPAAGTAPTTATAPATGTSPATTPATAPASPTRVRLTLDSLARGYVRCECFDDEGAFLGFYFGRIADLRANKTVILVLPVPSDKRLAKVVITY
jgi:hypothetical protein